MAGTHLLVTLASALSALVTLLAVRCYRISLLRRRAQQSLGPTHKDSQGLAAQIVQLTKDPANLAELAAYGGMAAAEYVWSWATIDPGVIRAAAFSSGTAIHTGLDFAQFIHSHYDCLSAAAKEGFFNRLLGYVGEQQLADLLVHQGHVVQSAEAATQPVWDLLVDGHVVNVKTVAHTASIKAEALAHHHVTYLVPHDAHGASLHNVVPVAGFHHDIAKESLKEGIASAKGETAAHGLGLHLPWVTIGFAVYRNYKAIELGKDPMVAVRHAAIESVGRGTGVVIGAKIGGVIGSFAGPLGALVGAIGCGIAGAVFGGALAEEYKLKPLHRALDEMREALHTFGAGFAPKLDSIRGYLEAPLVRMQESLQALSRQIHTRHSNWRWWLWPDFYTVLLEETAKAGSIRIEQERQDIGTVTAVLDDSQISGRYEKVGLLMANCPELCELVGFDAERLECVGAARARVLYERKQLNPQFAIPE